MYFAKTLLHTFENSMILSIPILFKYRKQTSVFLNKLNHQYEDYPVDGKYDFVENPLHIQYCMKTWSVFFSDIKRTKEDILMNFVEGKVHVMKKFEEISLLLFPNICQIYEKMALVEAFLQILFYIVNNFERIFPKSPSFIETWITIKQYSLLKQKILLFLYELKHVRLPCICDLRRKSMITDLRHIYSQFIEREWENDIVYSDMFTNPSLTLEKIGCFDLQNYISEFLEKPSLEKYTMEIKSAIKKTKEEPWIKMAREELEGPRWLDIYEEPRWLDFSRILEEFEYESLEEDELNLFESCKWTTPECFVMAHNDALSKILLKS